MSVYEYILPDGMVRCLCPLDFAELTDTLREIAGGGRMIFSEPLNLNLLSAVVNSLGWRKTLVGEKLVISYQGASVSIIWSTVEGATTVRFEATTLDWPALCQDVRSAPDPMSGATLIKERVDEELKTLDFLANVIEVINFVGHYTDEVIIYGKGK